MDFEQILYEQDGATARITLNRPEKLNAITPRMQRELHEAFWEADATAAVHAIVICGAGRAFSAGYDISPPRSPEEAHAMGFGGEGRRGRRDFDDDTWYLERDQRLRNALLDLHKPAIAQVHGYCLAGGTDLALLCDIVVAADDAVFGFPPVRNQGSPVAHMWTYHVGPQWAKYFLLTGDQVSGEEAARIGLVWKSFPHERLEAEVAALAEKMARIDPAILSSNKRIVNIALEMMGARTVQRMAAEMDARARLAPVVREFYRKIGEEGLKAALEWRDGAFADLTGSDVAAQRRAEQEARLERKQP
ncbi:MAG: crotonase/enoyl-CoA hydratase family protein [Chloroflexi bacterium]|nr:crotonase/enoyl-CoA hydratase family protein [Chloroflexota bacterium]